MEKFTTWRDPSTGIHPFLPITFPKEWTIPNILYRLVGISLALIRFPILILLVIGWLITLVPVTLFKMIRPIEAFRLLRTVDTIFGHLILMTLGYFYVPFRRMTFRPTQGEMAFTLAKPGQDEDKVHAGDILICNSQSPVDIIYLCYRYSPTFTTVDGETKKVTSCSRWFALLNCTLPGSHQFHHQLPLSSLVHQSPGPIVIFPEGTTSNGRALLPFIANMSKLPMNQRIHLIALKYISSNGGFMPTLPISGLFNFLRFFLFHLFQWQNTMSVKWINSTSIYRNDMMPSPQDEKFNVNLSTAMSLLLHARIVSISLGEKKAFLKAYAQ